MLRLINKLLEKVGVELKRCEERRPEPAVLIHEYVGPDGSFDYEKYRLIQASGNKQFLQNTWAIEENIAFAADYIRARLGQPRFGICHGTRRGDEQAWFRKYLGCEVIGTEISETAAQFPDTIQWDFHDVKPEWLGVVDFIYSNALDHSYDPEACLNAWMSCVRAGGLCILEHSTMHEPKAATELDPFGASLSLMPYLIAMWSRGNYVVRELLEAPRVDSVRKYIAETEPAYVSLIVLQKL